MDVRSVRVCFAGCSPLKEFAPLEVLTPLTPPPPPPPHLLSDPPLVSLCPNLALDMIPWSYSGIGLRYYKISFLVIVSNYLTTKFTYTHTHTYIYIYIYIYITNFYIHGKVRLGIRYSFLLHSTPINSPLYHDSVSCRSNVCVGV